MIRLSGIINEALGQPGQAIPNPYARAFAPMKEVETIKEQDHEVSMAQSSLDAIIKSANDLKQQLGTMEKEIPAWIQDHISKSENYIQQAANFYHEYESVEPIEEGRIPKLFLKIEAVKKEIAKLEAERKQAVQPWKTEKDPKKKEQILNKLKDLTKKINAHQKNLVKMLDMEDKYISQMAADAELDTKAFDGIYENKPQSKKYMSLDDSLKLTPILRK